MGKSNRFLVLLILCLLLFSSSCGENEQTESNEPPEPTGNSIGGSVLETGFEIDDDERIVEVETTFQANEDFYFSFYNNDPFEDDPITVKLIKKDNNKVLAENNYEVQPDREVITDMIWFNKSGLYEIIVDVGGAQRANQEVLIIESD